MSTNPLRFTIDEHEMGRADRVLASHFPEATRTRLAQLFADGHVRVDGKKAKKGQIVMAGQVVQLERAPLTDRDLQVIAEEGSLSILYEDAQLIVLNKPAGLACHPLRAGELGTLANVLVHEYPECASVGIDPREAGLAHRLDVHTSGVLLVARDQATWEALRQSFSHGEVDKQYLAAVHGLPIGNECSEPLQQRSKRSVVDHAGLDAHTTWQVLARSESFSFIRCEAHTGRMHQVRAHLAHCDSPIVGDLLYGGEAQEGFTGHFLHASRIGFRHPRTEETMRLEAALPAERSAWLAGVGLSC